MLATLTNIHKYYNGRMVLENISLTIHEQERLGLIGINGCGKTTLLRILTGKELPDRFTDEDGILSFAAKTSIGYLEQMGGLERDHTVLQEMQSVFAPLLAAQTRMRELETQMHGDFSKSVTEEYDRLTTQFESGEGYLIDVKIKTVLHGMGFGDETFDRIISGFSGGEKTRLAIARLLLEEPNLLILDEPTNHLDFQTVLWLEDYLKGYRGALLLVSHDRYFLDRLCTGICEIEGGHLTKYRGSYTAYTRQKAEVVARQQKEYEAQQKEIAKLEDYVARNLVRASTAKSAQGRLKTLEKMERIERPTGPRKNARLAFTYAVEPPFDLLEVKRIDISVGEGEKRHTLVENVSFSVKRGEKLGIIGENGSGKSTLLKILLEQLPHAGVVRWASNVKLSYFEQESANLNPRNTVIDELHDRYPAMTELELRNLLGLVRLTGENVFKEIGVISGGERAKVCFAILMQEHANVLILDEPTNHLDLATKEVLEEALAAYTGTVIFVSHDRYLLNRLSDRILEIKPQEAELFSGNFDRYLAVTRERTQQFQQAADREKQLRQIAQAKEKGVRAYRSKEQRSQEAKRRLEMKETEATIEALEQRQMELNVAMTDEEVCGDYQRLQEVCAELEDTKLKIDSLLERLVALEAGEE